MYNLRHRMCEEEDFTGNNEMLKALYDFEASLAKTLSFKEGDYFYLQQTNPRQRNWWHVVNRKGVVGFVPSNYVQTIKVEPEFFAAFLTDCLRYLHDGSPITAQKEELIDSLTEKKNSLTPLFKPRNEPTPIPPHLLDAAANGLSSSFDLRPLMSHQNLSEDGDNQDDSQDSSESIKPNAVYEIVQSVRKETQLSHEMSKVAVETVLKSLRNFMPEGAARSIIDALLRQAKSNITCPRNAIDAAPDALRMMTALNALSKAANDAQQRGWALHDDAHDIQTQLLELISVMSNADIKISQHVLRCHRYSYVTTLVQYYQMETRWPLRQLLLQAFGVMCGLERTALTTLAVSPLPAEIARDMRDNCTSLTRLSHSALLLSMVLSMGDPLPVTHFEQLGTQFTGFLIDLIERPPDSDIDEQIPDLFLTLILAYNLQFEDGEENVLLDTMDERKNAKIFCEKVLLLLNREDDPVRIFDHEPAPENSVLKLVNDLFFRPKSARHFYTNDIKVAIDIIARQLADLSPGEHRRKMYLKILQGIIRNTDYGSHQHRREDLLRCFSRIFCEEGEISKVDQALVRAISNEFPHYFKA